MQGLDLVDVSADFNENLEKYTQLDRGPNVDEFPRPEDLTKFILQPSEPQKPHTLTRFPSKMCFPTCRRIFFNSTSLLHTLQATFSFNSKSSVASTRLSSYGKSDDLILLGETRGKRLNKLMASSRFMAKSSIATVVHLLPSQTTSGVPLEGTNFRRHLRIR